jgi:hypothetical protein
MTELLASVAIGVSILLYVWWDCRRAEKRWHKPPPGDWRGSCLRDRERDKLDNRRYQYPKKDDENAPS